MKKKRKKKANINLEEYYYMFD